MRDTPPLLLLACLCGWPSAAQAGAWTLPEGAVWFKAAYFQQSADQWYIATPELSGGRRHAAGTRRPYRFGGQYRARALFLEGAYGLTGRLELGLQVPYFDQRFEDDTRLEPPEDAGFSDLRFFLRWRALARPALLTFKAGVKAPTGDFRNEDGLIPVGEGQWDFDGVAQVSRSLWPLPLYGNIELGYRMRLKNARVDQDPGDEWLVGGEAGWELVSWLAVAGKFEALRGKAGKSFGLPNRSQIKHIAYLTPTLFCKLPGDVVLEAGLRHSLGGRNYPAGRQLHLGAAVRAAGWRGWSGAARR